MALLTPVHRVAKSSAAVNRSADSRLIRKALIDRGWTVTTLAGYVGVTRTYMSQIVHGRAVGPVLQAQIAKALRVRGERAFPRRRGHQGRTRTSKDEQGQEKGAGRG